MSDKGYTRMLAPPGYTRRVDVPNDMVAQQLRKDPPFRIDESIPDDREPLAAELFGCLRGKAALCMASGPSMAPSLTDSPSIDTLAELCTCWATNNAFNARGGKPVPRCDFLVVLDRDFWEVNRQQIRDLQRSHRCLPCLPFQPSEALRYHELPIALSKTPELDPTPGNPPHPPGYTYPNDPPYEMGRYWHGNSSGVMAVQMALHARAEAIFLLGHDCQTAHGFTHGNGVRFHEELTKNYPQGKGMLASYRVLKKHAALLGIPIYNLSRVSAIKEFPVIDIGQAIDIARGIKAKATKLP